MLIGLHNSANPVVGLSTSAPIKKSKSQALYAHLPRGSLVLVSPAMASNQSENNAGFSSAPKPDRQCERFASTEGDVVVFRSIDHVLFNIHRVNLRVNTTGPFAEDFPSPKGDVADLTEDAKTLELLFRFIYSERHPTLADLPFDELLCLAEAAEKYGVAPAMNLCYVRLTLIYKDKPFEILVYAHKHAYTDLLDMCAPHTLGTPVEKVRTLLPASLFLAWVCYNDPWYRIITRETTEQLFNCSCKSSTGAAQRTLSTLIAQGPPAFLGLTSLSAKLRTASECTNSSRYNCSFWLNIWARELDVKLKALPPLSSFLRPTAAS
ncbi:uncharacterized protein SCHCODRAFT_02602933 [Schizophyllum commune H4-8]|nr:uncharacterized protein SCHCODRAFT_02602933 [Schizophyllum commune H4-8]KAI5886310.1 hypothetical protein SCHCODRAFT_02602933 [Schizophyllum commune H4-8]